MEAVAVVVIGVTSVVNYWILFGPIVILFHSENQLTQLNTQVNRSEGFLCFENPRLIALMSFDSIFRLFTSYRHSNGFANDQRRIARRQLSSQIGICKRYAYDICQFTQLQYQYSITSKFPFFLFYFIAQVFVSLSLFLSHNLISALFFLFLSFWSLHLLPIFKTFI